MKHFYLITNTSKKDIEPVAREIVRYLEKRGCTCKRRSGDLLPLTEDMPEDVKKNKILLNNYDALDRKGQRVRLRPYQAVVLATET